MRIFCFEISRISSNNKKTDAPYKVEGLVPGETPAKHAFKPEDFNELHRLVHSKMTASQLACHIANAKLREWGID